MNSGRSIIAAAFFSLALNAAQGEEDGFFREKILPILEQRCFECHSHQSGKMKGGLTLDSRSGWQAGGDQGPVIVPGDPEKSLLIKAVRRTDPDLRMPPKNALPAPEVALLEEWVKRGAPDPRQAAADANKIDTEWWSLRKPVHWPPPGEGHPIDAFITEKLRDAKIQPAPEADRRTLIRRITFDLHGLPPAPAEVEAFVKDSDPQAWEKLADRLLDSPRHGERWARHWLDAIHFADSHGFEHDLIRTNAWRYRDYVIESFNRDTPWARFIREQLAPDVFFPEAPELTVGLGFIAAGPWDHSTAQTAPKTSDNLDRDDIVTQTMSTFASATAHCARCHDHKFDPISQEDYYSLQAVFAGVGKGDVAYDRDLQVARERRRWNELTAAVDKNDRAILLSAENEKLAAGWESNRGPEAAWQILDPGVFQTASAATLKRLPDGSFLAEGTGKEADSYTLTATPNPGSITAIRLELLTDPSLPKNGPGRAENGNLHLSEFQVQLFERGAERAQKIKISRAFANFSQESWTIAHAIDGNEATAWGIHPRQGENHVAVFEFEKPLTLRESAQLAVQLKQLHGRNHLVGRFRLAVTGDDPARARPLPSEVSEALRLARDSRNETQRLAVAGIALREVARQALEKLPPPEVVFAAAPNFTAVAEGFSYKAWAEPKVVHVLHRGDINKPGAVAQPGAISSISGVKGRFDAPTEKQQRAALADWLADPNNPLTWRSAVNRVWHHHFGRGLVDSLNDFGRMGSQPTHPKLLDWLACEFQTTGGSLKALHRLIVLSAAYRRGYSSDPAAVEADPDNLLLWRGPRRRLDAESFRDAVLAVSGRLDLKMGGPPVQQFKLGKPIQLTPTVDYDPFTWDAPGANRRSVYRFVYRGLQDPFMDALDFPDAAQLAPVRPFSASPLQALALQNNDFVLHHSEALAKRVTAENSGLRGQVGAAFRLAFQREAAENELADFSEYATRHGLPALCRLLLNSNEFMFVN